MVASLGSIVYADQDEQCLLQGPASIAHSAHVEQSLLQQTVFTVKPELSVLEMSQEQFGCGKACAYMTFGALVAASMMRGTFAAQRWLKGPGDHCESKCETESNCETESKCETKALLKKECGKGKK